MTASILALRLIRCRFECIRPGREWGRSAVGRTLKSGKATAGSSLRPE
jgi:hypothetical protein